MIHFFQKINKSAATSFLALFLLASAATAGSLTPPGSPASTMNTLAELFDSIVGGFDSTGVVADQNGSLIEHLKYIEANMPGGVTSDSLDFDEFVDNMTLDADTDVANGGFALTFERASVSEIFEVTGSIASLSNSAQFRTAGVFIRPTATGGVYPDIGIVEISGYYDDIGGGFGGAIFITGGYSFDGGDGGDVTIEGGSTDGVGGFGGNLNLRAGFASGGATTGTLYINDGTGATMFVSGASLWVDPVATFNSDVTICGSASICTVAMGTMVFPERFHLDLFGSASVSRNFELTGTVSSHLIPTVHDTFDLGTSASRWRDLYLSGGTLYLGEEGNGASFSWDINNAELHYSANSGDIYFDQNMALHFDQGGNITISEGGSSTIIGGGILDINDVGGGSLNFASFLNVQTPDSSDAITINNAIFGTSSADAFALFQGDDGTGYIAVAEGPSFAFHADGAFYSEHTNGYVNDPGSFQYAISGGANVLDSGVAGSVIVAANGQAVFADTSGTGSTNTMIGGQFETITNGSGGTITYAFGVSGHVDGGGTDTIARAIGAAGNIVASDSVTITDAYALHGGIAEVNDAGQITNNYGLYLEDQSGIGTTLNYNLYSAGTGTNYFGGNVIAPGLSATSAGDDYVCRDPGTGEITFGATCTPSSIRFKKNVEDLSHGLDWVRELRPVTFDWKHNGDPSLGFIAEEVNEISPLLALYQDGEVYSVNYQIMTSVLAKAIQELDGKIDSLSTAGPLDLDSDDWLAGLFTRLIQRFADVLGIEFGAGGHIKAKELCLDDVCVTKEELQQLLQDGGAGTPGPTPEVSPEATPEMTPEASSPSPEPIPEENGSSDEPLSEQPTPAPEEPEATP